MKFLTFYEKIVLCYLDRRRNTLDSVLMAFPMEHRKHQDRWVHL